MRATRHIAAVALLAIAVWLLVRIALSAWEWARLEPTAPGSAMPAAASGDPARQAPGSGLFGTPGGSRPSAGTPGVLGGGDFRLRGVVASARRSMAHAIIESDGVSRVYFSGDLLATGLTLQEVRPDEVRLRRGAEILRLPLSRLATGRPRTPAPGRASQSRNEVAADRLEALPRMSLSQILRMEPVMADDGSMQGYRVFPGGQRGLFDALGLVSGDLVVAINGIPINSDNLPLARKQMTAGDMMLTVNRDGESLEIAVDSHNFGLLAM